jgi:hypothetical protein
MITLERRFESSSEFVNIVSRLKSGFWCAHCEKLLFEIPRLFPFYRLRVWCLYFCFSVFQYKSRRFAASSSSWSFTPDLSIFPGTTDLSGPRDGRHGRLLRMDGWFYHHEQSAEASRWIFTVDPPFRGYVSQCQGSFPPTKLVDSNRSYLLTSISLYADRPNLRHFTRCGNIPTRRSSLWDLKFDVLSSGTPKGFGVVGQDGISVNVFVIPVSTRRPCGAQSNLNFLKHIWDTFSFYKYASFILPSLEFVEYIRDFQAKNDGWQKPEYSFCRRFFELFYRKKVECIGLPQCYSTRYQVSSNPEGSRIRLCGPVRLEYRGIHDRLQDLLQNFKYVATCALLYEDRLPHAHPWYLSANYSLADETRLRHRPKSLYASPPIDCTG